MASNYPGSVDNPTNPASGNPLNSPDHAALHTLENQAIVAIENAVGFTGAFNFIQSSASVTGDLSGPVLAPSVIAIHDSPLGVITSASVNQVLTWGGSHWGPQSPTSGAPTGTAGGDLSGSYPNPTVAKINGSPLGSVTGASVGEVLTWTGSVWAASVQVFNGNQTTTVVATSGSSYTLTAPGTAVTDDVTLSANCTITGWASPQRGDIKDIIIRQKASGGTYTYTVSWTGSSFYTPGGSYPTMSTGASAYDYYTVAYDGSHFNLITVGQAFAL